MRLIVGFQPANAAPKRCPMWFWTSSLGVELRWLWRGGNGNTVADLGSGPGYFTAAMAEIVGPKGKVYAADSDDRSILALSLKAAKLGYENGIEAHATSAANLSFIPDSSVDFVFANGLLCCMVDHAGAISEIKRILKPGGRAYLSFRKVRRKKDPRAVSNDEWRRILASFILLREGEGLVRRWTLVSNGGIR